MQAGAKVAWKDEGSGNVLDVNVLEVCFSHKRKQPMTPEIWDLSN